MPVCLPEQFMSTGAGPPPARSTASRADSPIGSSGGQRRSASVRSARRSMARTRSMWKGSPEWLAATSARSAGSARRSPARTIATACIGLLAERGKHRAVGIADPGGERSTGIEHGNRTVMAPLDEPGSHHVRDWNPTAVPGCHQRPELRFGQARRAWLARWSASAAVAGPSGRNRRLGRPAGRCSPPAGPWRT